MRFKIYLDKVMLKKVLKLLAKLLILFKIIIIMVNLLLCFSIILQFYNFKITTCNFCEFINKHYVGNVTLSGYYSILYPQISLQIFLTNFQLSLLMAQ